MVWLRVGDGILTAAARARGFDLNAIDSSSRCHSGLRWKDRARGTVVLIVPTLLIQAFLAGERIRPAFGTHGHPVCTGRGTGSRDRTGRDHTLGWARRSVAANASAVG